MAERNGCAHRQGRRSRDGGQRDAKGVIVTNNAGETYTINAASTIITTRFAQQGAARRVCAGLRGFNTSTRWARPATS